MHSMTWPTLRSSVFYCSVMSHSVKQQKRHRLAYGAFLSQPESVKLFVGLVKPVHEVVYLAVVSKN